MEKTVGVVGLGKMGKGIAEKLLERGFRVVGYDPLVAEEAFSGKGLEIAGSLRGLVEKLSAPRVVWVMVPAGDAVEKTLFGSDGLSSALAANDTVIDAGNSLFTDTVRRKAALAEKGIHFIDVGFSGGPSGARNGGCLMIGGSKEGVAALEPLWEELALPSGFLHVGETGAGHFVKMVHNGIEYGMMQSLAEGFAVLKASPFKLNLTKIASLYNHGSVIESRLVGWLEKGYEAYSEDLTEISGTVAHTGEGEWTVKAAEELGVSTPSIKLAFDFRVESAKKPSYIGKILSALRNQFGGHSAK